MPTLPPMARGEGQRQMSNDWLEDAGETHGREVFVTEHETHSQILGPDGQPLQYQVAPFGFVMGKWG